MTEFNVEQEQKIEVPHLPKRDLVADKMVKYWVVSKDAALKLQDRMPSDRK